MFPVMTSTNSSNPFSCCSEMTALTSITSGWGMGGGGSGGVCVCFICCSLYLECHSYKYMYASFPHFIQVSSHWKGLPDQSR